MGTKTGISWTSATWNPIRGCSPVSPGCKNCYASKVAKRFSGPGSPYEGLVRINAAGQRTDEWNGVIRPIEKHLLDPLRWKEGRRIFVNSMSDLFHENLPFEEIDKIFAVMALCPQHEFQILTKRAARAWDYWFLVSSQNRLFWIAQAIDALFPERTKATIAAKERLFEGGPIPNARHGFSAENQKTFDERWDIMGRLAACRFPTFASLEPLLGPIDMGKGRLPDWVIVGGESGHGARPLHPEWARSLRDQCKAANVPYFFKQWGEWSHADYKKPSGTPGRYALMPQNGNDSSMYGGTFTELDHYPRQFTSFGSIVRERVGTKAAGHLLDGVEHHEFPEVQA